MEKRLVRFRLYFLVRETARCRPNGQAPSRSPEAPSRCNFPLISHKAARFTESVIRGMSIEARKHGAINLAQGMPDFPAPPEIKAAACQAIETDINQYAITWGAQNLREAIAEHADWHLGLQVDPETEITVTCGSTEAMLVALLSLINPGDEVILTQPFYENYWPDCVLAGATPRFVPLRPPALAVRPRRAGRGLQRPDQGDHPLQPQQPHRHGLLACRPRSDRRALPQMGCDRHHR